MSITEKFYSITGKPTEATLDNYMYAHYAYGLSNLTLDQQKQVEEALKEHLGFGKIEWIELPAQLVKNSKDEEVAVVAKTRKLNDDPTDEYEGRTCYLYKVLYTPELYDPEDINKPGKDGMLLSPLLHHPNNNTPSKKIIIEWQVEDLIDSKGIEPLTWEDEKTYLREKLETLLANPEDYKLVGKRSVLIRYALDKSQE